MVEEQLRFEENKDTAGNSESLAGDIWSQDNLNSFKQNSSKSENEKLLLGDLSIDDPATGDHDNVVRMQLGPNLADGHLNNPDYKQNYDKDGNLKNVVGPDGEATVKFSNYENGKPSIIDLPKLTDSASHRLQSTDGGRTYNWVDEKGKPNGLGPISNLEVDEKGNVSFDMLMPEGRITFTPDGKEIHAPTDKADWAERSKDAIVEKSDDGLKVLDKNGEPIRTVHYDENGNPELIKNSDGSSWHSFNGGESWTFTGPHGNSYPMQDAGNFRVDDYGNVIYNAYGKQVISTIDGKTIEEA